MRRLVPRRPLRDLPSWTSFLIRVYAWMGILKNNGVLNNVLMWLGVIDQPLVILHTNLAVSIGVVYTYLPIMILPIYTALTRLDYSLVEASLDLGARPLKTFFQVIVPLTKGGIIAGSMLVFIPAVGEYVIPELLGGPDSIMIVRILWQEFFNNRDWPVASAVVMPDVITGLSLLLLFVALGHAIGWPAERDMFTICLAHVTFCTAYVAVVMNSRLRELDQSIEEAAMDLGATPVKVFFIITLPMIAPAIISGWLLAFTLSLDDLVIASFVAGTGSTTLPMLVFSSVRMGVNLEINALATLILVGVIGLIA